MKRWTRKVPTVPGFYWNAELDGSYPYCCFWGKHDLEVLAREGTIWYGPVKVPRPNRRKKKKVEIIYNARVTNRWNTRAKC